MRKKLTIVLAVIMALVFFCSCGTGNIETEGNITFTDHADRTVVLEKEPETIVSSYYIATSMLIALDQEEKLVGVENEAGKRPVYELSAPRILDLPPMGTVKEFDLEKCAELQPDLVVIPYKLKDMTTAIEELGIPVMVVMPETPELLAETITMLGTATGCEDRAVELNQFITEQLENISTAVEGEDAPRVYLSSNSDFLRTACPAMYQHSLIETAGGQNVGKEIEDSYWSAVSYEQVLTWDPEYIILAADASYTEEDVLKDSNLQDCTAVKEGNVYRMPSDIECWDAPVPGSVLGASWLASVLHPEAYDKATHEEVVTEFYETFYGFTK